MDKKTANWLAERIQIISNEIEKTGWNIKKLTSNFKFENRMVSHPEECSLYEKGNFCHDGNGEEKYCLLCSCNHYDLSKDKGGCRVGNPFGTGELFDRSEYRLPEIFDCGNCLYPHSERATQSFLRYVKKKSSWGKVLEEVLENLLVK